VIKVGRHATTCERHGRNPRPVVTMERP